MPKHQKKRRYFTFREQEELFRRWRLGENTNAIARALASEKCAVRAQLAATGGFSPRPRRPSPLHLSDTERETISRCLMAGCSFRAIGLALGRPTSTVSREVARNGGRGEYRCVKAAARALAQAKRPKPCKLATHPRLRATVAGGLRKHWSPQQIAGWLKLQSSDSSMQISHEAIYQSLFIQTRGALKAELLDCLRSGRHLRRGKPADKDHRRGRIVDAVPISERPAAVEDRAVPGHWEGDLIVGAGNSYIVTLVERATRYVLLAKVESKETAVVIDALIRQAKKLPTELRHSLTLDRGSEFFQHARFTLATNMKVYFCDPHSPWQRGSNENTNGLLRQYFPKGRNLSGYAQPELDTVARELNGRPRQTLGFKTPAEMLNQALR